MQILHNTLSKFNPTQVYSLDVIISVGYRVKSLHNNPKTIFIVARNVKNWQNFLGTMWANDRFIVSKDYRGQRFTKEILGDDYEKVIAAFKN